MLKEVWEFLKYPENQTLDIDSAEKWKRFIKLLLLAVSFSILSGILLEGIATLFQLDFGTHAAEKLMEEFSIVAIFFLAVVLAPLIEELLFRAPLGLFQNRMTFVYAFYISILLFGMIHISNFEDLNGHYWAVPFMILPQLCAGTFLGFIRVKQGLIWSILLHAGHNLILIGPFIFFKLLDIPIE
jgi:membrane protease YdiL (CAAX protease family)